MPHIFICIDICITDVAPGSEPEKLSLPRFLHPLAAIIVCCCCRRGGHLSRTKEGVILFRGGQGGAWNNSIIFIASSHSRNVRGNICKWILLYFRVGFHYNIVVSSGKKGLAIWKGLRGTGGLTGNIYANGRARPS